MHPNAMVIIPALILLTSFSLWSSALLKLQSRSEFALSIYLTGYAAVIVPFTVLGWLDQLNQPLLFLIAEFLLAAIAGLAWLRAGKPALFGPFTHDLQRLSFKGFWQPLKQHPVLSAFAFLISLVYGLNAYLILHVPPNNVDSLYLHMARVAHWMQSGSLFHFSTPYPYQLFFPYNAQALIHWGVLFWGTDQLAGFAQYFAALTAGLAIMAVARRMGFSRSAAMFSGLLWLSFPQVLFQSTTTQNDMFPASMLIICLFFLLRAIQSNEHRQSIALASLAFAIGIGAKQTLFFCIPGLVLALLVALLQRKISLFPWLVNMSAFAIPFLAFFSAPVYIHNWVVYHNPMGDQKIVSSMTGVQDETPTAWAFWLNANRLAYQFIDTTGLPPIIEGPLFRGKGHIAKWVYAKLAMPLESSVAVNPNTLIGFSYTHRPPVQEDETWFGILAPLVVLPCALSLLFNRNRKLDGAVSILGLTALSFSIFEILFRPGWDIYLGRNFALAVVALTPMAATLYRRNWINQAVCAAVLVIAAMITINVTIQNKSKPLTGQYAIWNLDRAVMITLNSFSIREAVVLVEQDVPANAVVGTPSDYLEYSLYGDHLSRRIVPVFDRNQLVDRAWLKSQKVEYVIIPDQVMAQHPTLPGIEIARNGAHILVKLDP